MVAPTHVSPSGRPATLSPEVAARLGWAVYVEPKPPRKAGKSDDK